MQNSWQPFVEYKLIGSGSCIGGSILSKRQGNVWATSNGFYPRMYKGDVSREDGTEYKAVINESEIMVYLGNTLKRHDHGLRINGTKYMPLRTFPNGSAADNIPTVYFKKPGGGGCMCSTNRTIVVGIFEESAGMAAADCNDAVEKLARYLKKMGY